MMIPADTTLEAARVQFAVLRSIGLAGRARMVFDLNEGLRAMIEEPVFDHLPDVRAPTLVIFGADDALIPNAILHGGATGRVAQNALRIPRARLVVIPRAGHMVQFEKPEPWNRAVVEFLSPTSAKEEPR